MRLPAGSCESPDPAAWEALRKLFVLAAAASQRQDTGVRPMRACNDRCRAEPVLCAGCERGAEQLVCD